MKFKIVIFFLFLSFIAQAQYEGIPFIQNYPPESYKGYSQNWAAEQDNRGVMYFGNGKGILEYNGKTWRRFFTDKVSTVLSLGKDPRGRIFVGGENEIGYIAPDSTGLVRFYDLTYLIPEEHREFTYVWHVYANEKGTYFVTSEKVFRIKGKDVKVYSPKSRFFTSYMANNQFFIQDNGRGLLIEDGDSLALTKGGEAFGDIRGVFPYDKNQVLFVTRDRGCYLYDFENQGKYFATDAESLLKNYQYYKGIMLSDSTYVLGTLAGGVIHMNRQGKVLNVLNTENGLQGNSTYAVFEDKQGGVWCMLGNGLSRVDFASPLTQFDKRNGPEGIVQDIELVNGTLYAAVIGGLYEFKPSEIISSQYKNARFEIIPEFDEQYMGITKFNEEVLIVGTGGAYSWDGKTKRDIFSNKNEICIEASKYHKNIAFVGGSGLLYALKNENEKWTSYKMYDDGVEDLYYLAEQDSNTIWTSTVNNGMMRFDINDKEIFTCTLTYYDTTKGVPSGITEVANIQNEIIIGTNKGLMKYNKSSDSFIPANKFAFNLHDGKNPAFVIANDSKNRLWAMQEKTVGYSYSDNDSLRWFDYPFRKMQVNDIYKIFPVENGCLIGGTDGIFYYNEAKQIKGSEPLNTIITNVHTTKDTVFYGAYFDKDMLVSNTQPEQLISEFKFYHNAFIFEFALASFNNEEYNMFSIYLDGYDEDWSAWSFENKKEYTNLSEGTYTFKVKGLDIYQNESNVAEFKFTILPPWYRTYWAYTLYVIAFILIFYVSMRLNSYRLRAANQRLEAIVAKRTQELRERNEEIMQQKEEIESQRDEIEAQRDQVVQQNEAIMQQNEEIEAQRDEIESQRDMIVGQKQEIIDSINYASFIQKAILPPINIISNVFSDSFVLFKPKDIVSGDFYWFFEKENKTFVAAVDCTGHGVPGGFMSMLGIAFLTEIISNKKINTAAEVLNNLRELVIVSLHQKDTASSSKDGMDMALCMFDRDKNEIHFSGANNPLYIVKSEKLKEINKDVIASETKKSQNVILNDREESKLEEIKGDKMPIGIHYHESKDFTNHVIKVEKGDRLYLFSDGFADQFGGEKGKKFKYNNLKQLLIDSSNISMIEQKEILENSFINWISYIDSTGMPHEQIDDVLIVGFEI